MRWPWERGPWDRARRAGAEDHGATDAGDPPHGPSHPPAAPAPFSVRPLGPAAWRALPPVQRSVGDAAPAVAPPDAFRAGLTTHQNPSFLAPLGHLVDPDGPSGIVGGLASPAGRPIPYESGIELRVPERPRPKPVTAVQRRIATLQPDLADHDSPQSAPIDAPTDPAGQAPSPSLAEIAEPAVPSVVTAVDAVDADEPLPAPPALPREVSAVQPTTTAEATRTPAPSLPVQRAVEPAADHDRSASPDEAASLGATVTEIHAPTLGDAATRPGSQPAPALREPPAVQANGSALPQPRSTTPAPVDSAGSTIGPRDPAGPSRPPTATVSRTIDRPAASPGASGVVAPPTAPPSADLVVARQTDPAAPTATDATSVQRLELETAAPPAVEPAITAAPVVAGLESPGPDLESTGPDPVIAEPAVTGLLSSQPPLVEPPVEAPAEAPLMSGSAAPPPVPGNRGVESRSAVQRQVESLSSTAGPAATSVAEPSAGPGDAVIFSAGPGDAVISSTVPEVKRLSTMPVVNPSTGSRRVTEASSYAAQTVSDAEAVDDPPLVARSVQRRAVDSGTATGPSPAPQAEAPLSGFAAAISALQTEPSTDPDAMPRHESSQEPSSPEPASGRTPPVESPTPVESPDLLVARQVAATEPVEPTSMMPARSAGVPLLRGATFAAPPGPAARPELVVARRVAPDDVGHLLAADVRLPVPARPAHVQRNLIADLPPLLHADRSAAPAEPTQTPPPVQRIRYEDPAAPAHEPLDPPRAGRLAPAPSSIPIPTPQPLTPFAAATPDAVLGPVESLPSVPGRQPVPAPAPPAPPAAPAVQRHLLLPADEPAAPLATFGGNHAVQPSPAPVATPAAMVQRRPDNRQPPDAGSRTSGFGADGADSTDGAVTATAGRTVGLAEMFALAAAAPGAEPEVQRSVETEVQLAAADPAPAPAAPAPAGAAGGPAGAAAPSGADLDEMARRLYEPLSARLRAELWQDRERSGLLTDLRP